MSASQKWPRLFAERYSLYVLALVGISCFTIGSVLVYSDYETLLKGEFSLFVAIGGGIALIGSALALGIYYFGQSTEIVGTAEGFTVTIESRHQGKSEVRYAWSDVTDTSYSEEAFSESGDGKKVVGYFSAATSQGQAFSVSQNLWGFRNLIALFNDMTPHLPYVWNKQMGFSVTVAGMSAGRIAYTRAPRENAPKNAN